MKITKCRNSSKSWWVLISSLPTHHLLSADINSCFYLKHFRNFADKKFFHIFSKGHNAKMGDNWEKKICGRHYEQNRTDNTKTSISGNRCRFRVIHVQNAGQKLSVIDLHP